MQKCVIVGLGYFGKIIKSKLNNCELYTVDPFTKDVNYKSIDEVPFSDGKWFVTTPASTHYKILLELFEKGVKDIWVEKPICSSFEDTLDIFSKIPDDVFLYCDFTWLKHSVVQSLGKCDDIKHIELKWLNDGSMIPKDVNIVLDLAIHPLSIVNYFIVKSKDRVSFIDIKYSTENSVLLNGHSEKGITFNIEVSNSSMKKRRNISVYCKNNIYRWFSENEFFIENIGKIEKTDAIEKNIESFFNRINIGYSLDIARTLETVNKLFCG